MTEEIKKQPIRTFNSGVLTVSVWENTAQKDGETFTTHSVTIQRSFRDGNEWKQSTSLRNKDLPIVQIMLTKAFEFMNFKGD